MRFAQCVNIRLLPESLRAPLSDFLPPRPPRPVPRVGIALSRLTGVLGGIVVGVVPQRRRKRRVDLAGVCENWCYGGRDWGAAARLVARSL
jgi:hypothetical protein